MSIIHGPCRRRSIGPLPSCYLTSDLPVHLDRSCVELELLLHAVVSISQEGEPKAVVDHLGQLVPQLRVHVGKPLQRFALPAAEQQVVYLSGVLIREQDEKPIKWTCDEEMV